MTTTAEAEAEESIYNLLPKTYTPSPKPPLYRSPRLRHAARQPPIASTFGAFGGPHLLGQARFERRAWAHWGPAESQAADPKVRSISWDHKTLCYPPWHRIDCDLSTP